MELDELEVGEPRSRAVGRGHSFPESAGGIRRPLPERRSPTRGEECRASSDSAPVRDDAEAPLIRAPQLDHALALGDADARVRENALGEYSGHAVAGGSAACVHDSSPTVPAFEAEPFIELDAELDEIANSGRRFLGQHRDRASPAQPATRPQGVFGVEHGRIVVTDSRRDSTLGEHARGREKRPLRENQNVALGGRAQGCNEPGDSAANDDEIEFFLTRCAVFRAHASFRL